MWTAIAQIVSAVVSVFSLAWLVIVQVRTSTGRKHAERAETAARLLATLQEIGVGGSSARLADSYARELHDARVHGLQEVIRVNTAEFERRAKRPGLSLMAHLFVGSYGILALMAAAGVIGGLARLRQDQRWVGELLVAALFILGVVLILDLVLAFRRRLISRSVLRKAGLYVPSALEIISTNYVGFRQWRDRRRTRQSRRRKEAAAVRGQSEPQTHAE